MKVWRIIFVIIGLVFLDFWEDVCYSFGVGWILGRVKEGAGV